MTKIVEMRAELAEKRDAAQEMLNQNDMEGARALMKEVQALNDLIKTQEDLDKMEISTIENKAIPVATEKTETQKFCDAARKGFKNATMSEGTDSAGGYTVPADILTTVNQYRNASVNMRNYVDVQTVSTDSGRRIFQSRATRNGFSNISEGSAIGTATPPSFTKIDYTIKKYAGSILATNELLADSDANIANIIARELGENSRVGSNKAILAKLKPSSGNGTNLADLDGIKKALNVTLGQAFKPTSAIYTNDSGLQYLDTLQDDNGRYLLTPNPAEPTKMQLCCGATVVPVVVLPNADLANNADGTVPFIIGDLKEGIVVFDRANLTIAASTEATIGTGDSAINLFDQDMTAYRAIERYDVVVRDSAAYVYGYITLGE